MASLVETIAASTNLEVARIQRAGLPPDAVDKVAKLFHIPKARLLRALEMPVTTIATKARNHTKLSRDESESITRVVRLHSQAEAILPHPTKWFLEPNPSLGGQAPLDAAGTEAGGRAVENLLIQVEFGTAA